MVFHDVCAREKVPDLFGGHSKTDLTCLVVNLQIVIANPKRATLAFYANFYQNTLNYTVKYLLQNVSPKTLHSAKITFLRV